MSNNAAMLLVVKDADGAIFGAWLAEGIRYIKGGKGYYGGGESYVLHSASCWPADSPIFYKVFVEVH
jgi:hypothetical protein